MPYADPAVARVKHAEAHKRRQAAKRDRRILEREQRVSLRPRISTIDCAWAAGLFEGEGTATLNANATMRVRPVITMSNTDREVVDFFQDRWPGSIRERLPSSKTGNCRLVYNWTLSGGEQIERFIRDMLPFIRTKRVRDKMQIVLDDIIDRFANAQHGQVYERSLERMAVIRKLNHRGL